MNWLDNLYYRTLNSSSSGAKIVTGWVFVALGVVVFLTAGQEIFTIIRGLGFVMFGIGSFLSAEQIFGNWQIGPERFPIGFRKFLIIFLDFTGLILISIGFIYIFFFK